MSPEWTPDDSHAILDATMKVGAMTPEAEAAHPYHEEHGAWCRPCPAEAEAAHPEETLALREDRDVTRPDPSIDDAWAEVEERLPEEYRIRSLIRVRVPTVQGVEDGWEAVAARPRDQHIRKGTGRNPAAALYDLIP